MQHLQLLLRPRLTLSHHQNVSIFFFNFGNRVTSELYAATRGTETTCAEIHTFAISDQLLLTSR
jgi:hypothetical protein